MLVAIVSTLVVLQILQFLNFYCTLQQNTKCSVQHMVTSSFYSRVAQSEASHLITGVLVQKKINSP